MKRIGSDCIRPKLLLKRGLPALPRLWFQPIDDDGARLLGARAVARPEEDATSVENAFSMLQLGDTVNRLLPDEQVYNFRLKPETEIESSEKPDRASNEQSDDLSTCNRGMEIQVKANLSSDENLVYEDTRDDVQTHRHHARKAEADAKAGATRHLLSNPDDIAAEQADQATNAKVGQTQHSSRKPTINASDAKADQQSTSRGNEINYRNDLNRMLNCRRIRLNDRIQIKLPEVAEPRQKSTYTKGQNKQRQEDKKERRRAKRQSRRANNKTKMSTDHADLPSIEAVEETSPQNMSKQEVLETIEYVRENFARIMHNKDESDPTIKEIMEEFNEADRRHREWEDRFLYRIGASAYHSSEVSFVGEETAR